MVEQAATARFSFQLGGRGGASGAIVIVEILPVAFLASILQNSLDKKTAGKFCDRIRWKQYSLKQLICFSVKANCDLLNFKSEPAGIRIFIYENNNY